jgi:hypothetical protein
MNMLPRTIPPAQTIRARKGSGATEPLTRRVSQPIYRLRGGDTLPGDQLNGNSTEANPMVLQADVVGRAFVSGAPT